MPINRYRNASLVNAGVARGASNATSAIYAGIENGLISSKSRTFQEGERLDIIAGEEYNDSTLWWVIAAASGIGWGLQVPPGTNIVIPSIDDVTKVI